MKPDFTPDIESVREAARAMLEPAGARPAGPARVPARVLIGAAEADMALAEGLERLAAAGESGGGLDRPGGLEHALAVHLHLAAFAQAYETMPAKVWGACESAIPAAIEPFREAETYADRPPEPRRVAPAFWAALVLTGQAVALAREIDLEVVDGIVHQCLAPGGDSGPLCPPEADRAIETWTVDELASLHALANLALLRGRRPWAERAVRAAAAAAEVIQPDHATHRPWGLLAFYWHPRNRHVAEQRLHDARAAVTAGADPEVPLYLLADTVWGLERLGA